MKKNLIFNCFLLTTLLHLTGCKSFQSTHNAPIPYDFPMSAQQRVEAVEHWSNIAQDMVNQTVIALEKHKLFNAPLYIKHPPNKSEFAVAFHDFLIDGLVKKGIKVNRVNTNNTVLEYKIQPIEFSSNRSFPTSNNYGDESVLANGLIVRRNISEADSNVIHSKTENSNSNLWGNRAPNLELLISSSIVDKNIYLMKTTDIYYANQDDKSLYKGGRQSSRGRNSVFDDTFYHQ